jgi:hypothetical protein
MKTSYKVNPVASLLLVLIFGQLLVSCKQTGNPSDVQSGSITGIASLWDSAGPMTSSAGVMVTLDNSNYTTKTDSTGFWEIDNVAPGNYNVTVSKPGFGLCHAFGVTVEGPGTATVAPTMTFGIEPTTPLVLTNVAVTHGDSLLTGEFSGGNDNSGSGEDFLSLIFLDLTPNVQPADVHAQWLQPQSNENSNQFAFSLAGIPSGTTVYISGCQANFTSVWHPGGFIGSGTYTDTLGSTHFISPGPESNVVAITIP